MFASHLMCDTRSLQDIDDNDGMTGERVVGSHKSSRKVLHPVPNFALIFVASPLHFQDEEIISLVRGRSRSFRRGLDAPEYVFSFLLHARDG